MGTYPAVNKQENAVPAIHDKMSRYSKLMLQNDNQIVKLQRIYHPAIRLCDSSLRSKLRSNALAYLRRLFEFVI